MKKILLTAITCVGLLSSGQSQSSLNFNGGASNYVNLGNSVNTAFYTKNEVTLEAWVNPSTTAGYAVIVGNYDTDANNSEMQFLLRRDNDYYTFWVDDGTGFTPVLSPAASVVLNTWQHVAGSWDGSTLSIYINGVLQGTTPNVMGAAFSNTTNSVWIGGNVINEYFNGSIDEVRIWNKSRSQTLIQNYMNCSVTDTAAGLVAYYGFNEAPANGSNASYTTLHDASGNGYDGTLTNFSLTGASSNYVADKRSNYFGLQSSIGSTNPTSQLGNGVSADFNGDGSKDILVTDWNSNAVLYFNDGKGNFPLTYTTVINSAGGNYDAADIDNDGDIDFTCANFFSSSVKVYINNGSAVFTTLTITFNGTGAPSITKIADVNNDGKMDVIIGNNSVNATAHTEVWLNSGTTGNAAFTFAAGLDNSGGSKNSIAVGDINGDGAQDIITGSSSWSAELFLNNGNNGSFTQGTAPGGYGGGVKLADWDKDGILDYLNFDAYNNYGLRWRKGDGAGNFAATAFILAQTGVSNNCYLGDLNGDGFLDAVLDHWGGNAFVFVSNGCYLTQQNGCNYTLGHSDGGNVLADFNGDGSLDVFCGGRSQFSSFWMNYLTPVVTPALSNIITTTPASICGSGTAVLGATASNSGTVNWYTLSSGGGASLATGTSYTTPVISSTTTYYADATNANGCVSSRSAVVATVNPLPTITVSGTASICSGTSTTLTASGATTYTWSANAGSATTSTVSVNPASNTTYTVTGSNGTCQTSQMQTVTVTPTPTISISGPTSMCTGNVITLTGSGATTYTWSANAGGVNTATVSGSPAATDTYTLTGSTGGCNGSSAITVSVTTSPTVSVSGNTSICSGSTTTLTASGATTYTWGANAGNATTASVILTPGTTDTYTVTGANGNCTFIKTIVVGVTTTPTISIGGTTVICSGNSTVLTASGATNYTWSANAGSATSSAVTVNPSSNATYTITGANGNCTDVKTVSVNVTNTPTVNISGSTNICSGNSTNLTGSGATNYTWSANAGSATTSTVSVNPTITDTYTLTGESGGCSDTKLVTVNVTTTPTVSVSGNTSICSGMSTTLTGNGATSYAWSSNAGGALTTTVSVSPGSTDTYTVTGANGVCTDIKTITVTVTPTPTISISGITTICSGNNTTLTGTGATSYTWSANAGSANTSTVNVNPTVTDTYTLTGDDNGCSANMTVTVNVNTIPDVSITGNNSICSGMSTTLTGGGATTYTWSSNAGSVTTATVSVNPTSTDTYTLTGDNNCGTNVFVYTVTVTPTPTVAINGTTSICSGNSTILTGSGATSYTWSNNAGSATTSTVSVNPAITDTYTLTGVDNGCSADQTITVNVTATPTVSVSGTISICNGDNTTLTASGATTFTWSANAGSATTATVNVNPTSTDTYTVTGENGNCSDMKTVTVTVNSIPTVTFDVNPSQLCSTDPAVTLSATPSNGTFTGTGVSSNQFDPSVAGVGSYTLTYNYTDGNNCSNNDTAQVSVIICSTGINQLASNAISIYPNPATTMINVATSNLTANSVLEIYNSLGQKVSSVILSSTSTQVSINDLNNGIYEARIISNNVIVHKARIVKQF